MKKEVRIPISEWVQDRLNAMTAARSTLREGYADAVRMLNARELEALWTLIASHVDPAKVRGWSVAYGEEELVLSPPSPERFLSPPAAFRLTDKPADFTRLIH